MQPGDYGFINRDTGCFERDGNIWENEKTAVIADAYQPKQGPQKDFKQIVSKNATAYEMDISPHA